MTTFRLLCLCVVALAALPLQAKTTYRYVDSAGVTRVTDRLPVGRRYMAIHLREAPVARNKQPEPAAFPARYRVKNRLDPADNIRGGTRYLRDLLHMFDDDLALALAAYNAGENAVAKYGNRIPPYRETVEYVPRVLAYYRKYLGSP